MLPVGMMPARRDLFVVPSLRISLAAISIATRDLTARPRRAPAVRMQAETVRVANTIRTVLVETLIGMRDPIVLRRRDLVAMTQPETARVVNTTRIVRAGTSIAMQGLVVRLHRVRIATMRAEIVRRAATTMRIVQVGRMIRIVRVRVSIGIENRIGLRHRGLDVMMQAETARGGITARTVPMETLTGMRDPIVLPHRDRIATMKAEIVRRVGSTTRIVLVLKKEVVPNGMFRRRVRKPSP